MVGEIAPAAFFIGEVAGGGDVGAADVDFGDVGQLAEGDDAAGVAAQGDGDRLGVVAMGEIEVQRAVGERLAIAAAELEAVAVGVAGEEGGADAAGVEDAVHGVVLLGAEGDRVGAVARGDGAGEAEFERKGIGRDLEGHEHLRRELEVAADDALGGEAADEGGDEGERGFFDPLERQFVAVAGELEAEEEVRGAVGEELLAVEVEAGIEGDVVGARFEREGHGELAVADQAFAAGGGVAVGDEDAAGGVGLEDLGAEGDFGVLEQGAGGAEDADALAAGRALDVGDEAALADQGAGGDAAGDALDDPRAGAGELGEIDGLAVEHDGRLGEGEAPFVVGDEAVEVEVDGRLGALALDPGGEVEFEDADEEFRRVFQVEREFHRGIGGQGDGLAGGEGDAGILLEFEDFGGIEFRAPADGIGPGEELGAGVEAAEGLLFEVGLEGVRRVGGGEEVLEVGLDQRFVVFDRVAAGGGAEGAGGVEDDLALREFLDEEQRVTLAGQCEVGEEVVERELAEFALEAEVVEEDVAGQRGVAEFPGDDEFAAGGEVGGVGGEIEGEVGLAAGAEGFEVAGGEGFVGGEVRAGGEEFVELRPGEAGEELDRAGVEGRESSNFRSSRRIRASMDFRGSAS